MQSPVIDRHKTLALRPPETTAKKRLFATLLCFLLLGPPDLTSDARTINVFAAASLTDSLKEIAAAYEKPIGDKVVFNFGATSFLARQIEEGAPAGVFFSADEARMDGLEKKGLIVTAMRQSRLSNSLVVVSGVLIALGVMSFPLLVRSTRIALSPCLWHNSHWK